MRFMIFETVEVFVSFVTHIALVWFLLFHANSTWVWLVVVWIQDRESAIAVLLQPLILMTMRFVIFETVSIAIRLVCDHVLALVQTTAGE